MIISCDIGITSQGRTDYKLLFLGTPTIAMTQNQSMDLSAMKLSMLERTLLKTCCKHLAVLKNDASVVRRSSWKYLFKDAEIVFLTFFNNSLIQDVYNSLWLVA